MCIQCLRNPCAFCAVGVSRLTVERPSSNRKRKRDEATEHCASDVEKRGSCFLMMFSFWFATFEFFLFNQDEGSLVSWHLQLGVHQQCRARIRSMSLGSGEKHKQGSIACYRRAESKTDFFYFERSRIFPVVLFASPLWLSHLFRNLTYQLSLIENLKQRNAVRDHNKLTELA